MITKQFIKKYWYFSAGVVGVLSGVAVFSSDLNSGLYQGAIFGIFSAGYFFYFLPLRPRVSKLFLWVVASYLSFFLAIYVGSYFSNSFDLGFGFARDEDNTIVIGGLIGVLVLIVAFNFIFLRLSRWLISVLSLLGVLIPIITIMIGGELLFFNLFILWQTMVMFVLGYQIHLATPKEHL